MADIKGTNVASKIVPYTTSDNYATHDEEYGRGGYRTVNTVAEMNAIPADRRKEGMLVYVKNDKYYRLNSSNTFVDAGIGSSGGGDIYMVNTDKLNFELISDGKAATDNELAEVMAILERWGSSAIPLYLQSSIDTKGYVGVLNLSMVDGTDIVFSIPYNDTITLYSLNLSTTNWSVLDISAGGGGSGNVKVLTTPDLFYDGRNKYLNLNSNDCAIIKSLDNNNYKKVQLYYVGAPTGDDGIFPVNISSNSLSSNLTVGDSIYISIMTDMGNSRSERLDYISPTDIETATSNPSLNSDWNSSNNLAQNGYQKFNNGLMIQWGYMSPSSMNSATGKQTINFPVSFYNTYYTVVTTVISTHTSPIVKEIVSKYTSYFIVKSVQYGSIAGEPYNWMAIGRWK